MEIQGNKIVLTHKEKQDIINEFKHIILNSNELNFIEKTMIKKLFKVCKQINIEIVKNKKLYLITKVIMNDGSIALERKFDLIKTAENKKMITPEQKNELVNKMDNLIEGIHDTIILKDIKL